MLSVKGEHKRDEGRDGTGFVNRKASVVGGLDREKCEEKIAR